MKKAPMKALLACAVLAAGAVAADPALAGGRHHHHHGPRVTFGFHFGAPVWHAPYWYHPAPVYYYPTPIVVQPASPPVYVERSDQPAGYWYYCADARAYYPYVKECPGGWQRVSPTPPG